MILEDCAIPRATAITFQRQLFPMEPEMRINRALFLSLACLALGSCSGGGDESDAGADNACNALGVKVFGGEGCGNGNGPLAAIVTQDISGTFQLCSGTLVSPNQILTAGHCYDSGVIDAAVAVAGEIFQVTNAERHPRYNGSQPGAPFDLGVLTLNRESRVTPVPIFVSQKVEVGEQFTVFGYGSDEEGETGLDEGRDEILKAANMIASENAETVFLGDFDTLRTSVCTGDSGGPAIQVVNGVSGVVGVTSFDIAGCGSGSSSGFGAVAASENQSFLRKAAPRASFR